MSHLKRCCYLCLKAMHSNLVYHFLYHYWYCIRSVYVLFEYYYYLFWQLDLTVQSKSRLHKYAHTGRYR